MHATLIPSLCAGTELDIVNAARRSFDVQHEQWKPEDGKLLAFLFSEKHLLPFRHPQLSFSCEAPVFVARQLGKSQIGLSWSETSRRYQTKRMKFWSARVWRQKPENAKQGTGPAMAEWRQQVADLICDTTNSLAYTSYRLMLRLGVAPEQARAILPQSMYVYWTWTGSLLAWLHLIRERRHPNAQTETREWVEDCIVPAIRERFPRVYLELENERDIVREAKYIQSALERIGLDWDGVVLAEITRIVG